MKFWPFPIFVAVALAMTACPSSGLSSAAAAANEKLEAQGLPFRWTVQSTDSGEVMVMLINLGTDTVTIERGERIAQIIVAPVVQANLVEVRAVSETKRGTGGFGSTGTKSKAKAKKPA